MKVEKPPTKKGPMDAFHKVRSSTRSHSSSSIRDGTQERNLISAVSVAKTFWGNHTSVSIREVMGERNLINVVNVENFSLSTAFSLHIRKFTQ
jgi:hypothetical protein